MSDRIGTHSPNCWAFSHLHYDCAVRHIAELEAKLATAVGALERAKSIFDVYEDTEESEAIDQALASIQERT